MSRSARADVGVGDRGKLSWLTLAFEWLASLAPQSLLGAFPDLPIPLPEVTESGQLRAGGGVDRERQFGYSPGA